MDLTGFSMQFKLNQIVNINFHNFLNVILIGFVFKTAFINPYNNGNWTLVLIVWVNWLNYRILNNSHRLESSAIISACKVKSKNIGLNFTSSLNFNSFFSVVLLQSQSHLFSITVQGSHSNLLNISLL